jgi:L-2,4-diaminobutyrate decarboxylase
MEATERSVLAVHDRLTRDADELRARTNKAADAFRRKYGSPFLLAGSPEGLNELARMLAKATDAALSGHRFAGPLPAGACQEVFSAMANALGAVDLPREGVGPEAALSLVARLLVEHGLDLSHPRAVAHLQPPPLSVAVVADALASATNASLDTYDSGPSAIAIERWLIGVLVRLAKLGPRADGVLTPGGSISNLLGLLLARDAAALRCGVDARRAGVALLPRPVVLCSELAHFSVHRACAVLGLGEGAVLGIATDERRRMRPSALAHALRDMQPGQLPLAIVATAGTTDFGSIDPLSEIAEIAAAHGVWLHVDAAYGFGALFSERLAERMAGIDRADSVTLDLHKLGWQPAAASVLLVADQRTFAVLDREVAYLNPSDDTAVGLEGLLGRSLQTTRRADALKVVATMLAYGRRGLGGMVDVCHDLACYAEQRIGREPDLELVSPAELTTVVFRYQGTRRGHDSPEVADEINGAIRRRLLDRGVALIGRTSVRLTGCGTREHTCLKLTLLNPHASARDIDEIVDAVVSAGQAIEHRGEERVA